MSLKMQTVMSVVSKLRPRVTCSGIVSKPRQCGQLYMGLVMASAMDRVPEFMDLVWNVKQMTDHSLASMIKNDMEELGRRTAAQIARWTKDYLEEFQTANHRPQHFQYQQTTSWSLPHPRWYRINVDGAIFESLNEVGIGVIIRDHYGLVTA